MPRTGLRPPAWILVATLAVAVLAQGEESADSVARYVMQTVGATVRPCKDAEEDPGDFRGRLCADFRYGFSTFKSRWESALSRYDIPAEVIADSSWKLGASGYFREYDGDGWTLTVRFDPDRRGVRLEYGWEATEFGADGSARTYIDVKQGVDCPTDEGVPAPDASPHWSGQAGVTEPEVIDRPRGRYPGKAREAGREGTVCLRILVAPNGTVTEVEMLASSTPGFGFEKEARGWVGSWRYDPAELEGEPVAAYHTVLVEFRFHE